MNREMIIGLSRHKFNTDRRNEAVNAPQFFPSLEILRGLAALTVALYHVSWRTHFSDWGLVRNGYLMVDFFFILSGFVIFHAYGDRIRKLPDLWRFLVARLGRLYPLHLAMLLCFLLIEIAKWVVVRLQIAPIASIPFATNNASSFIASLLLMQGLGFYGEPTWNVPSWSISVEFWIYILFALLVLAARRTLLTGASICLLIGLLTSYWFEHGLTSTARFAFLRGLLGFFSGVLLRSLYADLRDRKFNQRGLGISLAIVGAITLVFLFWKHPGLSDFLCVPFFAAIILIAALGESNRQVLLRNHRLLALGTLSYSIYMVHSAVVWCFEFVLQHLVRMPRDFYYATNPWIGDLLALLFVALVIATARFTFRRIEEPGRLLARRLSG